MTAQERLDYLLEVVEQPITQPRYMSEIRTAVGDAWPMVRLTLESAKTVDPQTPPQQLIQAQIVAADISDAINALTTTGMRLDGEDRQSMIDDLAAGGQWPDQVRDAVKALGVVRSPRWQIEGYESEPTLQQIAIDLDKARLRKDASDRYNAFIDAVDAWDGSQPEPVL